ncbi:2-hydroxyhepta-2,4-diene-1,7-dioate isomerase [Candidatus Acidianus copahuensis]|uniref:2-hydroxyhepta-2,4-diene-1,7-dioate isomerase n=1 Tax=Candidatus Acidianus copahuensis TaxID=1160895 RepID=A0A031LRW3_9CREN|nr:fumarylacetoacetate hydrolase family protein [Candidatus Acidianus copahuensis]EZQ10556.1 2-hydroxyhepta-2,4-diene-1,7-dioate isomerase [Candidatus Acidianus copahuensis]
MKLLTFSHEGQKSIGFLLERENIVIDLSEAYQQVFEGIPPEWFFNMKSLISGGKGAMKLLYEVVREVERNFQEFKAYRQQEITFYPPVENPEKIYLLAVNYRAHGEETGTKPPDEPYLFTKFNNALTGHNRPVIIPKGNHKVDHEIELAVIIGKAGKYVEKTKAMDYVFGYTILNDISFRDRQLPPRGQFGHSWVHGKGMDTAAPMGPYIVTKDEIENPYLLKLQLRVNDEIRQEAYAEDMIHKIDEIVEYITQGITLTPGDIISTGTPPGVALSTGKYLKEGDVVDAEISGIGVLRNFIIKEDE